MRPTILGPLAALLLLASGPLAEAQTQPARAAGAAGATGQVQYNNGGALAGAAGITTSDGNALSAAGNLTAGTYNTAGFYGMRFNASSGLLGLSRSSDGGVIISIDTGSNAFTIGKITLSATNSVIMNNNGAVIQMGTSADTGVSRTAAGVVAVGNGTSGNTAGKLIATSYNTVPKTVSTLPASPTDGDRSFVTDATACTFGSSPTGGGSTHCPVYYDGGASAWKEG